jgi:hypothetical protein
LHPRELARRQATQRHGYTIPADYRKALCGDDFEEASVPEFSVGLMDQVCSSCGALHFAGEKTKGQTDNRYVYSLF